MSPIRESRMIFLLKGLQELCIMHTAKDAGLVMLSGGRSFYDWLHISMVLMRAGVLWRKETQTGREET